ncbi:MAG TPA: DUF3144 domain-containing protein [Gammaproteobacteria bacterium]|nr:DUF3144 domain-containing protein [Gammaproteobacteria bacterium]
MQAHTLTKRPQDNRNIMSDNKQETPFFEIADQFIDLANKLAQTEGSANVGTALRYAAARYNTFEASLSTKDLAKDEAQIIDMLCDDFREMLKVNMQDYIQRLAKKD